ncbi:MAG: HNH endonuclease [Chloroflexota bacterium]|nr:HNH endonuclease [Chloroflexota bacterium]
MARARNIKPGFFANEVLVELEMATRLLFVGLWTVADREGRMEDRPKRIRADLFPYEMHLDVDQMLNDLRSAGFLIRYDVDGARFIQVVNFSKHQNPHARETPSIIPPPPGTDAVTTITYDVALETRAMVFARDEHKCVRCGSPDQLSVDHITPRSKGGSNDESNLQTLCVTCNVSKNNRTYAEDDQGTAKAMTEHSQGDDRAQPRSPLTDSLNLVTDSLISDSPTPPPVTPDEPAETVKSQTIHEQRFDQFWTAYPKRVGKEAARRWWLKAKPDAALLATMLKAIEVQKLSPQWCKDGGQFIPNPATWLGQGRWDDDVSTSVTRIAARASPAKSEIPRDEFPEDGGLAKWREMQRQAGDLRGSTWEREATH